MNTALVSSLVLLGVTAASVATVSHAQTISPRTAPVQMGQQFDLIPSDRGPMGGIRIAVDDALLDPFVNPAKATRPASSFLSVAPYFVGQSDNRGGGRTLPISGVFTDGKWAFGGMFAMQQLDRTRLAFNAPLAEQTATNQYVSGIVARKFGNGYSLGVSGYSATLEAEQGIDQLYAGSDRILQRGSSADMRVGITREWGERKVWEAIVLHSRFDMTHDVHWPFIRRWMGPDSIIETPEREENHRDQTTRWGLHTEHTRPLGTEGWTLGVLGTVNRLSHPKIPDYRINDVITVPRDPGHTWAYNAGVGLSREVGHATFGFDLIMEPISSVTWADAARDTVSASGVRIAKGGHTVDNRFRFNNRQMRVGFEHIAPPDSVGHFGIQLGLAVSSFRYRLEQDDRIRETSRVQHEDWMEWTPSIGFKIRNPKYELRYGFTFTCGGGGDCIDFPSGDDVMVAPGDGGVIAAPTDQLRFDGGLVTTHRLSFSLRFR
jgi:hypothetical protein